MLSSSFSGNIFAINVSLPFIMLKFWAGGINILFAPLQMPKTNRFPGHGVLLSNLFKKINFFFKFFPSQFTLCSGRRRIVRHKSLQHVLFFKRWWEGTSRVAALENTSI